MEREIIFVGDPMCSWCWGFAPALAAITRDYGGDVPVSVVVGGLRPGTTAPMDERHKATVRHHWEEVRARTGQPFDFSFFKRDAFVYDTEPPCRAVVTVRTLASGAALPFLERLHRAFYAENRDITALETLAPLAEDEGIDPIDFARVFSAAEMKLETANDFRFAQRLGVTGFPTLVAREDHEFRYLAVGCQPLEALTPLLDSWLGRT